MVDQLERCVLSEGDDEIDALERSQDVRAVRFSSDWARRTLEASYGRISVYAYNQRIARRACRRQEVDVAWVQKVEHAVGENDPALVFSPPPFRLRPRRDLPRRISSRQSRLLTNG